MPGQDTIMKFLTRSLSGGALQVLGVHGVELAEPLPTELPSNTLRIDKAWRMRDGRVFHLEFQSTREPTLHRFLEYDARLARQHFAQVRTVVLYHANIQSAPSELDIGTAMYRVENVFLSDLNGDAALKEVEEHLRIGQWEPGDRLRLALALNMNVRSVSTAFERVLELVPAVPDETERDLVVSAILALGDQSLNDQQRTRLRKELRKVSKIVEELYEEGRQEGRQEGEHLKAVQVAEKMFRKGASLSDVIDITGLSEQEAEEIRRKLMN
ncbi:hypothetical protein [Kyrpidia sp.]|uniref:hypothetical protein n=1 Tax=Kyrpidia sp. TaxID=2073077 RepID=UPI002587019C|nr:hypothetical protein [Kyrpidia sp.]MCL6577697.1 hypothetical protein [Kyrpidia sp.]